MSKKKNLFEAGNPGGPGRPALPEDIKAARQLNSVEFERIVNKYLYMTADEMERLGKDKAAKATMPAIEIMLFSIISRAISEGDQTRLNFILDRIIGRVPVKVAIPIPDDGPRYVREVSGMTDDEVKAELQRLKGLAQ